MIDTHSAPVNPHLAFLPAETAKDAALSITDMLGIPENRVEELFAIMESADDDSATHSETLALISQRVAKPQELMLLGHAYIETMIKFGRMEKKVAKILNKR